MIMGDFNFDVEEVRIWMSIAAPGAMTLDVGPTCFGGSEAKPSPEAHLRHTRDRRAHAAPSRWSRPGGRSHRHDDGGPLPANAMRHGSGQRKR